ncbi:MAG: hypothetical protein WA138_16075 [Parvibaculum sp.]
MENLLLKWFGDLTILIIPLVAGVVSSFIIEAINQSTPDKIKGKYLTAIICLVVGVFLIFGFPNVVTTWFDRILIVVLNWAFAISFYAIAGKLVVQKIIGKAINVVGKKTDG